MKSKKNGWIALGVGMLTLAVGVGVVSTSQATSEQEEGKINSINYYYEADVTTNFPNFRPHQDSKPVTLTVNHYVDGYKGEYSLYKQEQYFNLSSNALVFNPKEHYLDFSWTEWEPEYSHTSLESDDPIRVDTDLNGGTINYYYMVDVTTGFHNNGTQYKHEPTTLTLNHYVDGYSNEFYLYKQEQYFQLSSNALTFDPKEHYLDFSWTEWSPEFSHTNLSSDDVIQLD